MCWPARADNSLSNLLAQYSVDPSNASLCEQIGLAYTRANDFDNAATFFRKTLSLNPRRTSAERNLGTVLWFAGHRAESKSVFASLAERFPSDPVPQLYLGLSAYDAGDTQTAALHFERAGALASENPEVIPAVAGSYIATGRLGTATAILDRRVRSGNADSKTYRLLGQAYDAQSLPEKAYGAYSNAIEMDGRDPDNYFALAAFSIEHANLPYAREVLNRGLEKIPGSSKLQLELGLAFATQGDFEAAKQHFRLASASDARSALPLLALGITDLQTGKAEAAADCFRKAESIEPNAFHSYYLHGLALTRTPQIQNPSIAAEAISELRHAVALDPKRSDARALLAATELREGDEQAAEADFRKALSINRDDATALYRLALLCRKQNKDAEAERLLTQFRKVKSKLHEQENEYVLILKTIQ